MTVTGLYGAGAGLTIGLYATVGAGPATSTGTLEGFSISVGGGAAVSAVPSPTGWFGASIEHDLMTAQTTLDIDIPLPFTGLGWAAYAAIRISGNLTACSSKLNPIDNGIERFDKMLGYLKGIKSNIDAANDMFMGRFFPSGSGHQRLTETGTIIKDDHWE